MVEQTVVRASIDLYVSRPSEGSEERRREARPRMTGSPVSVTDSYLSGCCEKVEDGYLTPLASEVREIDCQKRLMSPGWMIVIDARHPKNSLLEGFEVKDLVSEWIDCP